MKWIEHFEDLHPHYRYAVCDVWGVIHNGREAFPAASRALSAFQAAGGVVALLTNAPRPAADVKRQLQMFGVADSAYTLVITSGMATQALLAQYAATGACYVIGPDRDNGLYVGLDIAFADLDDAQFISCTGLFHDESETPEDYRALLTDAAVRGLPMICANPDKVVHRGTQLIPCAGALGDLYEQIGGKVLYGGKPYAPIYDLALKALADHTGQPIDRKQVLAIGDGPETDVLGAMNNRLDCLYIAGGLLEAEDAPAAEAGLLKYNVQARWGMAKLA